MKKIIPLFLLLPLLLCSCTGGEAAGQKQYTATFLTLFDTVTTVVGKAESEAAFQEKVKPLHDDLEKYHRLFDIYNTYEGLVNLKTVNDTAGNAPVKVDPILLDLIADCKTYYTVTGGKFNPALGSVLQLWHEARNDGINDPLHAYLPEENALREAAKHCNPEDIVIDWENSTVFFADPLLKLDVGGIAKGWAVQKACEKIQDGLLVSVGGNVYATGPKTVEGAPWGVGIVDPFGKSEYLHILNIKKGSVVTSGSYQRAYTVEGKRYHHIIDPDTLYPTDLWVSVTVVTEDSGLADILSTTLFLLSREEGQKILDRYEAEALWVDTKGTKFYSPGFQGLVRN